MSTNPSAGDTVIPTKTSIITRPGELCPRKIEGLLARAESTPAARKRHLESTSSPKTEVPTKSPRRGEPPPKEEERRIRFGEESQPQSIPAVCVANNHKRTESRPDVPRDKTQRMREHPAASTLPRPSKRPSEDAQEARRSRSQNELHVEVSPPDLPQKPFPKRDEAVKLRKTIQWLEEGARRMREDLAATRAELHEERRAARLARRELDAAVKDAKTGEAARHLHIISELKSRLAQSPTRPVADPALTSSKAEYLRVENHRRELSALRKRLAEAEATVQKLRATVCSPHGSGKRRKVENPDGRRLEVEVQALRNANKKLEERLQVVADAERKRATELRTQHENHEAQLAALQRTLRSDTIKMMDEIRSKTREIEKLEKIVFESSQMQKKLQTKEDDLMRKLRETERNHQIRLVPRIEDKISSSSDHVESLCNGECDASAEVERLRELSVEQQEIIEVLRQAVKEKERKLDQISNKKRKEEFYKQWLELEPVVEVEDEDEHEEGDSALSSAPSSLSPQPGGCGQWQHTGVTREAYETVLLEVEELQTRLVEEQRELAHAKSQVRDLEKALLQETRGSQNSRRALSDKLREMEDREATLVAEISELREQNELLEFRVLELEETPGLRDTPDPADSGIVSPEPIHLYKDQLGKQRDRAVATVIPYNTYNSPVSPIPQKPPLSLQESGIFEEEDEAEVELASCGTQTETPAGDLLQEVQRLHELRARIQERAVKVPVPMIDTKFHSMNDVSEITEAGQTNVISFQERIRELEQRLEDHEEIEKKRVKEKQLSKQREEELLDENYRLTEKIYWFENILRNSKNTENNEEKAKENVNVDSQIETTLQISSEDSDDASDSEVTIYQQPGISREKLFSVGDVEAKEHSRIEEPEKTELLTKHRIGDLEELRKKLELELSAKEELVLRVNQLEGKLKEAERSNVENHGKCNNSGLDPCPRHKIDCHGCEDEVKTSVSTPMEIDEPSDVVDGVNTSRTINLSTTECEQVEILPTIASPLTCVSVVNLTLQQDTTMMTDGSKVLVPEVVAELATEAMEEDVSTKVNEEFEKVPKVYISGVGSAAEVAEEVREESAADVPEKAKEKETVDQAEAEPVVTINETEPKKKVRQRGDGNKERERDRKREGWVMKAWNKNDRIGNLLSLEMKPTQGFPILCSRIGGFLPAEEDLALFSLAVPLAEVDELPFSTR